ncbi:CHY zinc finger protein [Bacillus carboniphilus]|uniref:CHY zinc finger protein n=1 Tax=Bacillus carboniphilus TaxID=86663 RepID=UPI0031D50933
MNIHGINIKGAVTDNQTRCKHYHSEKDIIAIKFKCCDTYYPCYHCHQEIAGHEPEVWKEEEFDQRAILCGSCGTEITIHEYRNCGSTCPHCKASFNPGCALHYHLYFER